jgi:hypothetical protein
MDDIPYSGQVAIIIAAAAAATMLGYAVWRLRFHHPTDALSKFDISDAQKEYLRSVREINRRAIMADHGMRYP